MDDDEQISLLASVLANALSQGTNGHHGSHGGSHGDSGGQGNGNGNGDAEPDWSRVTRWLTEDTHIASALRIELARAVSNTGSTPDQTSAALHTDQPDYWAARLRDDPHARSALSALVLDEQVDPDVVKKATRSRRFRRGSTMHDGWLKRQTSVAWMHILILLPMLVVFLTVWGGPGRAATDADVSVVILKSFAVWALSFVPTWLYVRFLGQRAAAIWNEYVVNLHRLGVDEPRYLPRPPKASEFYAEWLDQHGDLEHGDRNLYRQKFNAYFGRSVSRSDPGEDFIVTTETMFPVFLSTMVLATCWVAVLWDTGFAQQVASVWDVVKFGFLGAYAFTVQSLIRRFFQSDLRPSAYAAVILRLIVVFSVLLALYGLIDGLDPGMQAAVAFVVGGFPLVGVYALHRTAAVALRGPVPQLTPPYPLSQIDGLNVWYEARLLEEGIEDMQTLATANLVDVILHTRVPVGRLVDWVDQAYLYLHLDRSEVTRGERRRAGQAPKDQSGTGHEADRDEGHDGDRGEVEVHGPDHDGPVDHLVDHLGASLGPNSRAGTQTKTLLRQLGVRNATDLLKAFPPEQVDPERGRGPTSPRFASLLPSYVDEDQIRTLVRVLDEEAGLAPIWNWQTRGVRTRQPGRRPRSVRRQDDSAPVQGAKGAPSHPSREEHR